MMNTNKNSFFGFDFLEIVFGDNSNNPVEILRHIDTLLREMPQQLNEISMRAELSLPMLKHISDVTIKIKEPILVLSQRMENIKAIRNYMLTAKTNEIIQNFVCTTCDKDPKALPN